MPNQQQWVNQRLFHFHLQLKGGQSSPELLSAQVESLCFHLVLAYRAYLYELAANYLLDKSAVESAISLQQMLRSRQMESGEVNYLVQLEQQHGSWLFELLNSYRKIQQPPPAPAASSKGDINLFTIADNEVEGLPTLQAVTAFGAALTDLIEQQRSGFDEW